jgi:hypothetical protein
MALLQAQREEMAYSDEKKKIPRVGRMIGSDEAVRGITQIRFEILDVRHKTASCKIIE